MWWIEAPEKKTRAFFLPFILFEGNILNICVLSQCIVYWIQFQNIHTFTYQKHYFIHFCCLFLKLSKAFSVSLNKSRASWAYKIMKIKILKSRQVQVKLVLEWNCSFRFASYKQCYHKVYQNISIGEIGRVYHY